MVIMEKKIENVGITEKNIESTIIGLGPLSSRQTDH